MNINELPNKVISNIVSQVEIETLSSLSLVNKTFHSLIESSTATNVQNFHLRCFYNKKICKRPGKYKSKILNALNKDSLKNSNRDFTEEFLIALKMKLPKVITFFLQNLKIDLMIDVQSERSCTVKLYEELLRWAIKDGQDKLVELLLNKEEIDFSKLSKKGIEELMISFIKSAELGYDKVVKLLIENSKFVLTDDVINVAFEGSVSSRDNHKVIALLLEKYQDILCQKVFEKAINSTLTFGATKILKILLKCKKIDFSLIDLNYSIGWAASYGYTDTLELLFSKDKINLSSFNIRNGLFSGAIYNGHPKAFQIVFENKKINCSLRQLSELYKISIERDYYKIVTKILKNEKIRIKVTYDNKSIIENIAKKISEAHLEKTKTLFETEDPYITLSNLEKIIKTAVDEGHSQTIKLLFKAINNGQNNLPVEDLQNIYDKVILNENFEITQLIEKRLKEKIVVS